MASVSQKPIGPSGISPSERLSSADCESLRTQREALRSNQKILEDQARQMEAAAAKLKESADALQKELESRPTFHVVELLNDERLPYHLPFFNLHDDEWERINGLRDTADRFSAGAESLRHSAEEFAKQRAGIPYPIECIPCHHIEPINLPNFQRLLKQLEPLPEATRHGGELSKKSPMD